jgi:hypothetical protein
MNKGKSQDDAKKGSQAAKDSSPGSKESKEQNRAAQTPAAKDRKD